MGFKHVISSYKFLKFANEDDGAGLRPLCMCTAREEWSSGALELKKHMNGNINAKARSDTMLIDQMIDRSIDWLDERRIGGLRKKYTGRTFIVKSRNNSHPIIP